MESNEQLRVIVDRLACPTTGQTFRLRTRSEAESEMGTTLAPLRTNGTEKAAPIGTTDVVIVRSDLAVAYPVVDGIPVLLAPEALGDARDAGEFDLSQPAFDEAYLEMDFYNQVGAEEADNITASEGWEILDHLVKNATGTPLDFMNPPSAWLDAVYDSASQADAYEALRPIPGRVFAQVGGKGIHAIKFLLAGAESAWVVTPMLGEAKCAIALAQSFGVSERLHTIVGVAEQLPVCDELFDGIFVGGSVHHMQTALAFPQMARSLKPGGVFAAVEPYRAPLYDLGTKILGKREANAHCTPMDDDRIAPLAESFANSSVRHHGTLTRYPLLALWKFGLTTPFKRVWAINRFDDKLCRRFRRLRTSGSSICLLGEK